jgi:hypothetical protein
MKNSVQRTSCSLWEIETEAQAEGQEWMRLRLQQELQKEADQHGRVFLQSGRRLWHAKAQPIQLHNSVVVVTLTVRHDADPANGHWGCPIRRAGLTAESRAGHRRQGIQGGQGRDLNRLAEMTPHLVILSTANDLDLSRRCFLPATRQPERTL